MTEGPLPNYKEQLLVYDYKNNRRYLWEDKKYMDVNILRRYGLVIRARSRSQEYRDVNAHQCSKLGHKYLEAINYAKSPMGKAILKELTCKRCGRIFQIILEDEQPMLRCEKCNSSFNKSCKTVAAQVDQPFFSSILEVFFFLSGGNFSIRTISLSELSVLYKNND